MVKKSENLFIDRHSINKTINLKLFSFLNKGLNPISNTPAYNNRNALKQVPVVSKKTAIPESEILFQNHEVCIVSPNTPGSVLVIHHCPKDVFNSVLKEGVKSREMLFFEGKVPCLLDHLSDYNENVFFRCFRSTMTIDSAEFIEKYQSHPSEWVAISVDPTKTYAYDSTARINNKSFEYSQSKISLSDLMEGARSYSSEVLVKLPVVNPEWYASNSKAFKEELTSSRALIRI